MGQLALDSADASMPVIDDLAGLLCGHGHIASFAGTAARLSIVVGQQWRVGALSAEFAARGLDAEVASTEAGHPLVRTAFRADLLPMAHAWSAGAVKAVPAGFSLDGAALRLWMLAGGRWDRHGFLLALDPRARAMQEPLLRRVAALGLVPAARSASLVGARGSAPAVRIVGAKRVRRLAELVGQAPPGAQTCWPAARRQASAR